MRPDIPRPTPAYPFSAILLDSVEVFGFPYVAHRLRKLPAWEQELWLRFLQGKPARRAAMPARLSALATPEQEHELRQMLWSV